MRRMESKHESERSNRQTRQRSSFTADPNLLAEAKALGINISRAAEAGISEEIRKARKAKWLEENAEAIESWNEYVRTNGLPLQKYRRA